MNKLRAAIVGGSGYAAAELIRILLEHPAVDVAAVSSTTRADRPIAAVHPNLTGFVDRTFTAASPMELAAEVDILFFATPHGTAMHQLPPIVERYPQLKIIDLSADYRLRDAAVFEHYYAESHPDISLADSFVYGLTEFNREAIAAAHCVANPGCFATGVLLALGPLAAEGLLDTARVVVQGVTGSSGSGATPTAGTHHPQRAADFRAYRPLAHRHEPEIRQTLAQWGAPPKSFVFLPHSAPLARGIYITATVLLEGAQQAAAAHDAILTRYADEPFVCCLPEPPHLTHVKGTNMVHLFAVVEGATLVIFTALDNLVKGASGQAVQNMNRMIGCDERTALFQPGGRP